MKMSIPRELFPVQYFKNQRGVGLVSLAAKFQMFTEIQTCFKSVLPGSYTVQIITILKYWVGWELYLA